MAGVHKFENKSGSHLKILGAGRVTWNKFRVKVLQILGAIVQNLVTATTWLAEFMHPWPVEQCLNDTDGKNDVLGEKKNLSQCHFVHQKSHMDWPGMEPKPPRWEECKGFNIKAGGTYSYRYGLSVMADGVEGFVPVITFLWWETRAIFWNGIINRLLSLLESVCAIPWVRWFVRVITWWIVSITVLTAGDVDVAILRLGATWPT